MAMRLIFSRAEGSMRLAAIPLFLLVPAFAFAQKAGPLSRDKVAAELLAIEQNIARANSTCDYDYFRKIEADEFIFTGPQGGVITRAEDLAGEKDCKPHDDRHLIDEPRLLLEGNVAILNAHATLTGQRNGKDVHVETRFTDVFVWRDGRWQLVAGHSSRIPQKV
jgi:ketosteroid isomerase-like protein